MASVLVTGGAGYVGSHTCKLLASKGIEPIAFDSLRNGHRDAVRWGPLVVGDIRDQAAIYATLRRHRIEAVFHFAALAYVGESVVLPDQYYSVNVAGTLALLTAMREASVTRIVFSSSCATYGIPGSVPIDEGQQQRPINPYGRTKLIGEQILSDHSAAFSLDYAILRYFNAAGCDPDGDLVERHDPETHLIPRALMAAGRFGPSLQVLGTDYNTPDGTAIRDYIHVSDLAMAHWLTYVSLLQGKGPIILNLGTGRGKSVREIVDTVQRISGLRVPIVNGPRRLGDPPVLVAATDRSTTILDFSPRYSDLETIVGTAWRGVQSVYGKRRR